MFKFLKAVTAGCTCMTKTYEIKYHSPECKHRVAWEDYFNKDGKKMTKEKWINEANNYFVKITGWDTDSGREYCEALYENYIEDPVLGDDWSPHDAVDEDMSYWGD